MNPFSPFIALGPRRVGLLSSPPSVLRRLLAASVMAGVLSTSSPATAQTPPGAIDPYGGVVPQVAPATGYFQVKQVGDRWMFVTPDGNGMWMTGVFGATFVDAVDDFGTRSLPRLVAKYGGGSDWQNHWRVNTARRLKQWGFNTLSAYHNWAMRSGPLPDPNPERIPYIHIINPVRYSLWNGFDLGAGPVKDLIVGTDSHYDGYRGARAMDFFDPNFESYVDGWMRGDDGLMYGNLGNPWMLGIAMDESDSLIGFGPGPEIPAPRLHPHPGWIALVTNFEQACNPWVGASKPTACSPASRYTDRKVYTKYAWRDFLAGKYGTVAALNAAWGSTYTSFESDGGWGVGTGLLDENGRNPWVGVWSDEMATASPGARADMHEFLYLYARRYFTVTAAKIRQYAPMHLVFGPTSLNGWGGLTRKEILRAAGESVDVLQAAVGSQRVLDLTATYAGNKPIVTWDTVIGNADSALWRYSNPEDIAGHSRLAANQAERGQRYADKVDFLFNAATPSGVHAVAGITFWAWTDHWGERANFGLVTLSDNAYDGWQAAVGGGTDGAGWPTGGEERNYGDFVSAVAAANATVARTLGGVVTPGSGTLVNVEAPLDGAIVLRRPTVSGWAFDGSTLNGPGVDMIRVYHGTACSGTVLADARLGLARPDVQATYGLGPTFANTGFKATVPLPSTGRQQITVCARNTLSGTFAARQTLSLTARVQRFR